MPTLLHITQEMESLLRTMDETENDAVGGDVDIALCKWAESLNGDLEAKVDDYAALIRSLELSAKMRQGEADRMKQLANADEAKAERLKAWLKLCLDRMNIRKVDTARFRVGIQKNGGRVPVKIECDIDSLDPRFRVATYRADSEKIRVALESGETIPGCSFGERGESIRIK